MNQKYKIDKFKTTIVENNKTNFVIIFLRIWLLLFFL